MPDWWIYRRSGDGRWLAGHSIAGFEKILIALFVSPIIGFVLVTLSCE